MRFFYAPSVDASTLNPEESKHLVRVLRAAEGDRIGWSMAKAIGTGV